MPALAQLASAELTNTSYLHFENLTSLEIPSFDRSPNGFGANTDSQLLQCSRSDGERAFSTSPCRKLEGVKESENESKSSFINSR